MIDKQTILEISEPVARMYDAAANRLLINAASHFKGKENVEITEWQAKMLGEVGKLTEESVKIIAEETGAAPEAIRSAMKKAVGMSLEEVEKDLAEAAAKSYIKAPSGDIYASERVQAVIKSLTEQAVEDINLVNTVMLDSTLGRYRAAVEFATDEAARIEGLMSVKNHAELIGKLDIAQEALNEAAGSVSMATATRQQALRRAIGHMAAQGITGFIDAGGHHWTPEAYVNMDVRTTVHNAMIQSQKARAEDYGVTTFQVSTKAAARPLCAPYQGKILSWTPGDRGTVYDLRGNAYEYQSVYDTSYGEPAGLFGINCGHSPQTFVSGYSLPRYKPLDSEAEQRNKEQYAQSQQQNKLERGVRKAKTEALAYDAAGDHEAFEKAAAKVKEKTAQYKTFCAEIGCTPRLDRTQVFGYNRSIAGKVTAADKLRDKRAVWDKTFNEKYIAKSKYELLPNYAYPEGILKKLSSYSLNPEHERGKNKATVFKKALGYSLDNAGELERQIRAGLKVYKAEAVEDNGFGKKANVIMLIQGPNGKQPVITSWIFDPGNNNPRMVTAYVSDKNRRP